MIQADENLSRSEYAAWIDSKYCRVCSWTCWPFKHLAVMAYGPLKLPHGFEPSAKKSEWQNGEMSSWSKLSRSSLVIWFMWAALMSKQRSAVWRVTQPEFAKSSHNGGTQMELFRGGTTPWNMARELCSVENDIMLWRKNWYNLVMLLASASSCADTVRRRRLWNPRQLVASMNRKMTSSFGVVEWFNGVVRFEALGFGLTRVTIFSTSPHRTIAAGGNRICWWLCTGSRPPVEFWPSQSCSSACWFHPRCFLLSDRPLANPP